MMRVLLRSNEEKGPTVVGPFSNHGWSFLRQWANHGWSFLRVIHIRSRDVEGEGVRPTSQGYEILAAYDIHPAV
jgi:hypothetical protein